jgi:hypothetical protein
MTTNITPIQKVRPDVANLRRIAFLNALEEIRDEDVRTRIFDMIESIAAVLMQEGNLGQYAAQNQATEFVASCVWNGAQGRGLA